jgi:hypothetical protein
MKQNLTVNLIPYRVVSDAIELYFSDKPGNGQKIFKNWVPVDLKVPSDENGNTYWSFEESPIATNVRFEFSINNNDDKYRRYFMRRIFTQLLYRHFKNNNFIVGTSYVGDAKVWIQSNIQPPIKNYIVYDKFSLRIELDAFKKHTGVFLSYDGQSSITTSTMIKLNIEDPQVIRKVIHNNQVYSRNHDDFPDLLDDCQVVFNKRIENALGITVDKKRSLNKYRDYYNKILDFHHKYLRSQTIGGCFEILSSDFISVPESSIFYVNEESNLLEFKDHVRNVNVYDGLKRAGGPYFTPEFNNLKFLFVFMESDREAANRLFSFLKKGYKNFPGIEKYVAVPLNVDFNKSLRIHSEETIIDDVTNWLNQTNFETNSKFFVLYISPINKNEEDAERHSVYYKIKELLLQKEISSQVVFKDHLYDEAFNFYLPNIAVAICAKLGGIPWRLPYPLKKDLILGIGAFHDTEMPSAFIGSAICFRNDGQFEEFKVFPSVDIVELSQSLKNSIREFIDRMGGCDRLVIHYYKTIGMKERDILDSAMKQLEINIPYIFITVNDTESKDYVIFDEAFDGRIPTSGTIVKLRFNEFLLCSNTRYQSNTGQKLYGYPFPIKIKIISQPKEITDDFATVREILDQVYEFSRIYFKSIRQRNKPVTIEYSEIIAEVVSQFKNRKLPESQTATKSLWFL